MNEREQELIESVLYALNCGCFFPVPNPRKGATVRELIQWGAMRHLHDKIVAYRRQASVPVEESK